MSTTPEIHRTTPACTPFRAYASGQIELIDANGRVFAVVDGDFSSGDDRANSEFIVNACNAHDELLAAAKNALDHMCKTIAPNNAFTDAVDQLDAAIAKAEGR